MERRNLDCELRAAGTKIIGAIPYGSEADLGHFKEVLAPGCFRSTLEGGDKVYAFWSHDSSRPIGNTDKGTLKLKDSQSELQVEIIPDQETSWGRDALHAARDGNVGGFSFGFIVDDDSWEDGKREVRKARLLEISPVVFPAYKQSSISVRNKDMSENITISKQEYEDLMERTINFPQPVDTTIDLPEDEKREVDRQPQRQPRRNPSPGGNGVEFRDFENYVRRGIVTEKLEERAAYESDPTAGGYAVPDQTETKLRNYLYDASVIRQLALVTQVYSPDYNRIVNHGGVGGGWVGEIEDRDETDTFDLGKVHFKPFELYAFPMISEWMSQDAREDIEAFLIREVGNKFVSLEGDAYINGDGVTSPNGILSYSRSTDDDDDRAADTLKYISTGNTTTSVKTDGLINTIDDLRGVYRKGAAWVMNSSTLYMIRKLKDGNGQYIWQPSLQAGMPSQLLGFPCYADENMPTTYTTGEPVALFGNFRLGYEIAERSPLTVLRDPYSNKPYIGFYCRKRVSAAIIDTNAIRVMTLA